MPSTGFTFPGTVVSGPGSSSTWSNPSNATADDGSTTDTSTTLLQGESNKLEVKNFSFSLAAGSTIDGVEVKIDQAANQAAQLLKAQLTSDGSSGIGTSKFWEPPGSLTVRTEGGAADVWGATLTEAIIESSTFGVLITGIIVDSDTTFIVDYVQINVHYTLGSAPTTNEAPLRQNYSPLRWR